MDTPDYSSTPTLPMGTNNLGGRTTPSHAMGVSNPPPVYSTINKARQRHPSNTSTNGPPDATVYYQDEWTYPSPYVLAKNLQNQGLPPLPLMVSNPSSYTPSPQHQYSTLSSHPQQPGVVYDPCGGMFMSGANNVTLNHTAPTGPHAVYIQNPNNSNTSGASSPSIGFFTQTPTRQSPYYNNQYGTQQRRTPVDTANLMSNAAIVKQLQEKFAPPPADFSDTTADPSSHHAGSVNQAYATTIQRRLAQQQQQLQQQMKNGSVLSDGPLSSMDPSRLTHQNHAPSVSSGRGSEGPSPYPLEDSCVAKPPSEPDPPPVRDSSSNNLIRTSTSTDNNSRNNNNRPPHQNKSEVAGHCRLPLLIVLAIILTGVFITLSALIFYFKYIPYSFPGAAFMSDDEPCEESKCAFGASCVIESNGVAYCKCPDTCTTNYDPVCGTDDVTYSNECLLRMFACQNKIPVRVKMGGECDTPDPCADKVCYFGSRCAPSSDGKFATCECPTSCPNYGDTDESHPVCGSNGRFYRNRCEMDREACSSGRNITVRYHGKCDPCQDLSCPPPEVCHLDEERRPECRCGEMCPMDFNPVCGSDGKTYSNECVMRQEGCRSRREIRVIYRGKCSSGTNPCESKTCRGYESCAINKFGIARCICAMTCDPIMSPVCGSDGHTYDSVCDLTSSSCREGRNVAVAYHGACETGSACSAHKCPPGAACVSKDGAAQCECPSCPADYDPVCGSDGVSYQNECKLKLESCLSNNSEIKVLYSGLCNGCDRKHCDFYGVCIAEEAEAKCVCPKDCKSETLLQSTPVCGSDGVTYSNECDLRKAACRNHRLILVSSKGHCDQCAGVDCKYGGQCENGTCVCPMDCPSHREPVCGSNLITYPNECELQKQACKLRKSLSVHFYGDCTEGINRPHTSVTSFQGPHPTPPTEATNRADPATSSERPRMCEAIRCDHGALCEIGDDGFPRCSCQFNCSSSPARRICASDLKLYPNECEMRREGCQRQSELKPRPMELCEEPEIKPCNGETPLKTPESGLDIYCGSGPGRSSCPTGTYCHKTTTFAKCCKKPEEKTTTTKRPFVRPAQQKCDDTVYGCCPDGLTAALGEDNAGCPSVCRCNKVGSIAETCDPFSGECRCRPGVATPKCDRCLPGFWGLSRIVLEGHLGCRECGCSKFGSVRDDCEQMTGRCVCKPGVLGHKCDSCAQGEVLGPYGCTSDPINLGRTCSEIVCSFSAECEQDGNRAGCVCNLQCSDDAEVEEVCASDGFTYESECLVRLQACRTQKGIWILHKGPCPNSGEARIAVVATDAPSRRWTALQYTDYTEPGDDGFFDKSNGEIRPSEGGSGGPSGSSSMKSTRHLLSHTKHYLLEAQQEHELRTHQSATTVAVQIKSYLGDSCSTSSDCATSNSVCLSGWCICREGFYEDLSRVQCKPIHSHISGEFSCSKDADLCQKPSTCIDHRNGTFSCLCPLGKSSVATAQCDQKEVAHPFFAGSSTITLGKLAGYHKLSLEVELTPYLNYAHGILIFSSQHGNGTGDFLSLALIDGYVEFRYDLGDGPALLRSLNRLQSGATYHVVAKRYNRDGLLRIDGEEEVKGTSPGAMKSLNLNHDSWMGLVPMNSTRVWELVGTSQGFIGCVHKLKVGRRIIDFSGSKREPFLTKVHQVYQCPSLSLSHRSSTTTPMTNLIDDDLFEAELGYGGTGKRDFGDDDNEEQEPTETPPCSKRNPCGTNGLCWNDKGASGGYKCVCHPEFTGKHCESRTSQLGETGAMLDFRGFTYLELPRIENGARHVNIELWFMVRSQNCLILYNGQEAHKGDFIAILVVNGHLQFLFDLGSGVANITWSTPITLNQWHWVVASRDGRDGKLQLDGKAPISGKSPGSLSELNLELPLYFGGVRDGSTLHREINVMAPFDGALQYIKINAETYYQEISDGLAERRLHKYEGPPCGSSVMQPCSNGGTCLPRLESHVCLCPAPWSGKACEGQREVPGPVRFDGQNYLQLPLKIEKEQAFNISEYDDFYNDHFDSHLDELFGGMREDSVDFDDGEQDFVPILDEDFVEKFKTHSRNRIEVVFRTTTQSPGLILWMGVNKHGDNAETIQRSYLGLFIVDGFPEVRIDLDATKNKKPVIIRSRVQVNDNRWHQILIARRKRSIVVQVDGTSTRRATAPVGTEVLVTDGQFWIGGVSSSILPGEIPASYHQGFTGCIDLVRIEKRRLPLTKLAYATGTPFCEEYA